MGRSKALHHVYEPQNFSENIAEVVDSKPFPSASRTKDQKSKRRTRRVTNEQDTPQIPTRNSSRVVEGSLPAVTSSPLTRFVSSSEAISVHHLIPGLSHSSLGTSYSSSTTRLSNDVPSNRQSSVASLGNLSFKPSSLLVTSYNTLESVSSSFPVTPSSNMETPSIRLDSTELSPRTRSTFERSGPSKIPQKHDGPTYDPSAHLSSSSSIASISSRSSSHRSFSDQLSMLPFPSLLTSKSNKNRLRETSAPHSLGQSHSTRESSSAMLSWDRLPDNSTHSSFISSANRSPRANDFPVQGVGMPAWPSGSSLTMNTLPFPSKSFKPRARNNLHSTILPRAPRPIPPIDAERSKMFLSDVFPSAKSPRSGTSSPLTLSAFSMQDASESSKVSLTSGTPEPTTPTPSIKDERPTTPTLSINDGRTPKRPYGAYIQHTFNSSLSSLTQSPVIPQEFLDGQNPGRTSLCRHAAISSRSDVSLVSASERSIDSASTQEVDVSSICRSSFSLNNSEVSLDFKSFGHTGMSKRPRKPAKETTASRLAQAIMSKLHVKEADPTPSEPVVEEKEVEPLEERLEGRRLGLDIEPSTFMGQQLTSSPKQSSETLDLEFIPQKFYAFEKEATNSLESVASPVLKAPSNLTDNLPPPPVIPPRRQRIPRASLFARDIQEDVEEASDENAEISEDEIDQLIKAQGRRLVDFQKLEERFEQKEQEARKRRRSETMQRMLQEKEAVVEPEATMPRLDSISVPQVINAHSSHPSVATIDEFFDAPDGPEHPSAKQVGHHAPVILEEAEQTKQGFQNDEDCEKAETSLGQEVASLSVVKDAHEAQIMALSSSNPSNEKSPKTRHYLTPQPLTISKYDSSYALSVPSTPVSPSIRISPFSSSSSFYALSNASSRGTSFSGDRSCVEGRKHKFLARARKFSLRKGEERIDLGVSPESLGLRELWDMENALGGALSPGFTKGGKLFSTRRRSISVISQDDRPFILPEYGWGISPSFVSTRSLDSHESLDIPKSKESLTLLSKVERFQMEEKDRIKQIADRVRNLEDVRQVILPVVQN